MSTIENRCRFADNHAAIISHTKAWVDKVIVRMNICPFAKAEVQAQTIHYLVIPPARFNNYLDRLWDACQQLDKDSSIATTLLIFSDPEMDFDQYLDLLTCAQQQLANDNYEGTYQLASFHPDYCFDEQATQDAANFTNRAPYPTLHLIREADITKALSNFLRPEMIPERNIEYTRRKGVVQMQSLLDSCYDTPTAE
ncbi:DUF1415 domain-containing protein [Psychrobium sp. nBUS_13]|uniref:DUF1415 domain-containing protein n=1 Tax=Psychrobium sp. nBUS_13 TaxID=3395319 RepID=UPI003EBA58A2